MMTRAIMSKRRPVKTLSIGPDNSLRASTTRSGDLGGAYGESFDISDA